MSSIQSVDQKHRSEVKQLDKILSWITWGGLVVILVIVISLYVFFQWNRKYSTDWPIDAETWGRYGDFFGGVIGTLIAFVSILCLLKAYREQRDSNFQLSESTSRFASLLCPPRNSLKSRLSRGLTTHWLRSIKISFLVIKVIIIPMGGKPLTP